MNQQQDLIQLKRSDFNLLKKLHEEKKITIILVSQHGRCFADYAQRDHYEFGRQVMYEIKKYSLIRKELEKRGLAVRFIVRYGEELADRGFPIQRFIDIRRNKRSNFRRTKRTERKIKCSRI